MLSNSSSSNSLIPAHLNPNPSNPSNPPPPNPAPNHQTHPAAHPAHHSNPSSSAEMIQSLLGPNTAPLQMSDETLRAALQLRTEQEKTKQEYYRLELQRKTAEILENAIRNKIPQSMIPTLFQQDQDQLNSNSTGQPYNQLSQPQPPPATYNQPYNPAATAVSQPAAAAYNQPSHYSPTRGPAAIVQQPAFQPNPRPLSWQLPSSSGHQSIQFHHWTPSQQKNGSAGSPKKEDSKRRRSATVSEHNNDSRNESRNEAGRNLVTVSETNNDNQQGRAGSPTLNSKDTFAIATAAAAHSRKRSTHTRHRSETSVLRGDSLSKMSLDTFSGNVSKQKSQSKPDHAKIDHTKQEYPKNEQHHIQLGHHTPSLPPPTASTRLPDSNTSFNFLASVAADSQRLASPAHHGTSSSPLSHSSSSTRSTTTLGSGSGGSSKSIGTLDQNFSYPPKPPAHVNNVNNATPEKRDEASFGSHRHQPSMDVEMSTENSSSEQLRSRKQGVEFIISGNDY